MCRAVVAPGTQPALFGVGIVQRTIKAGLYITQPLLIAVADIVITHQFAVTATFPGFARRLPGKKLVAISRSLYRYAASAKSGVGIGILSPTLVAYY